MRFTPFHIGPRFLSVQFGSASVAPGLVLFLVALGACADDAPAPAQLECEGEPYTPYVEQVLLSQFSDRPFAVDLELGTLLSDYEHREGRSMNIGLQYTDSVFQGRPVPLYDGMRAYCPELDPSFAVSLDGNVVSEKPIGGWVCRLGGAVCNYPGVMFPISTDDHTPDSVLTISDRSRTITVPLGDTFLERTLAPVGQDDGPFHVGQQVTFTWSPVEDLTTYTASQSAGLFVVPGNYTAYELDSVTRTQDGVVVTMPNQVGDGQLGVSLTRTENDGASVVTTSQVAFHDVSIVP